VSREALVPSDTGGAVFDVAEGIALVYAESFVGGTDFARAVGLCALSIAGHFRGGASRRGLPLSWRPENVSVELVG
jgi:hypothetical protein